MNRVTIKWLFVLLCYFFTAGDTGAQSLLSPFQGSSSPQDTLKEKVQQIPLNNINNATAEAYNLFNRASSVLMSPGERSYISVMTDSLIRRISGSLNDQPETDYERLSLRELEQLENFILLQQGEIEALQKRIDGHLDVIQQRSKALQENRKRWSETLGGADDSSDIPQTLVRRINRVISSNDSVRIKLQADIDFLYDESDRLTTLQVRLDQFRSDLNVYGKFTTSMLLSRDMPPLWGLFGQSDSVKSLFQWPDIQSGIADDSREMVRSYSGRVILVLLLFGILVALVFYLKITLKELNVRQNKVLLSLYINEIFHKPFEVALLIGIYLLRLMIDELPDFYATVIALLFVYAVIRLAIDILPPGFRKFLIGFATAYLLLRFYSLFYDHQIISRTILLAAQLIAMLYLVLFVNGRRVMLSKKRNAFNYTLTLFSIFYLVLLIVAFLGNVSGAVTFSGYISSAIINSGFLMITTYVGFHISVALFYMFLSSKVFKRSLIVQQQSAYIFTKVYHLFRWFFILAWIYIALEQFHIRSPFFDWASGFLTTELAIGQATFTLMSIILFVFVIWLSLMISRFVRHILQEEVFTRITVERGIPGTITMLVRIALITIGFLLAAAAAGMKLSNLTIIIGAFSVGIGFGLQNIFNNLVSGLILAFERPIKEGDIVEVNSLLGTVKRIGIRSSVVRTFDGAEVIVPNGTLISNDLINWTLSDAQRRADIRVGVAYGTDPEKILQILLKVAGENSRAIQDPPPRAFFLGFGDSSLDFRLLAWTDLDNRLEMESEIKVAINRELKEAGIEIPFPQRDLHIRSVDPKAGKNLK
jgi:potassium-dependent mechanosensitive channel